MTDHDQPDDDHTGGPPPADPPGEESPVAEPPEQPEPTEVASPPEVADEAGAQRPRIPPIATAAWFALVVLVVAAGVVVWQVSPLSGGGGGSAPAPLETETRTEGPRLAEWDPRVRALIGFVERTRGLRFKEVVPVEFVTWDEFADELRVAVEELGDEEREGLESWSAVLRALGLMTGEFDVLAHLGEPAGSGVVGIYDFERKRIVIPGDDPGGVEELTRAMEVTLVHELTHALQDQHFDLGRLGRFDTDGESAAFRALAEGDAERVAGAYVERLNRRELIEYVTEIEAQAEMIEAAQEGVPEVLGAYFSAPYALGWVFTELLVAARGPGAVDEAFASPPSAEVHVFDPWTFIDGRPLRTLDPPSLAPGERLVEDGDLGVLTWFLFLSERVDAREALRAVDGWVSDSYVIFERAGRTCIRAHFQGATNRDNVEMAGALERWAAAMREGAVSVDRQATVVEFTSCDPGAEGAPSVTGDSSRALLAPLVRSLVSLAAFEEGTSAEEARCLGTELVDRLSLAELETLSDPAQVGQSIALLARVAEVRDMCLAVGG